MPFEYRVSSLSCRRTIHEHRLLVCRRFTSSLSFQTGERLVKCFYDARFRVTALLQDTLLSTAFEIKFQIKIWEGIQVAPPRGNVRGNKAIRSFHSCEISHLDCRFFFFFFFFHSNFLARNYANFQLDDFPDDRYKKKKILTNLIHVTRYE